jgi:uncharacterized protein YceK
MKHQVLFSIVLISLLSGCASVTGSSTQNISIQTRAPDGKEVKEAQCDLINKRGTYFLTTPGTIMISRSNDDLTVTCRKDGFDNGRAGVVSNTKGSMFGNILLGGGIGAIVDHNTGSAYEYPSFVQVVMGSNVTIGTKREEVSQNQNPMMGASSSPASQNQTSKSSTSKLKELKKLKDEDLISQEIYEQRQAAILKESN